MCRSCGHNHSESSWCFDKHMPFILPWTSRWIHSMWIFRSSYKYRVFAQVLVSSILVAPRFLWSCERFVKEMSISAWNKALWPWTSRVWNKQVPCCCFHRQRYTSLGASENASRLWVDLEMDAIHGIHATSNTLMVSAMRYPNAGQPFGLSLSIETHCYAPRSHCDPLLSAQVTNCLVLICT